MWYLLLFALVHVASAYVSSTLVDSVEDHYCNGGVWDTSKMKYESGNTLYTSQQCVDYCSNWVYTSGPYNTGDTIRHYATNRVRGTSKTCFCHYPESTINNHCEIRDHQIYSTYYDILYIDTVVIDPCASSSTALSEECVYSVCTEGEYILNMYDSFDDGWHGGQLTIKYIDSYGESKTLSKTVEGSLGGATFTGTVTEMYMVFSSYADEVSWTLTPTPGVSKTWGSFDSGMNYQTYTASLSDIPGCALSTCPAGHVYNSGECTVLVNCDTGEFKSGSVCESCPSGWYQDGTGQTSCKSCDSGQYQDQTGQASCNECEIGSYEDEEGKSSCKSCDAGQYQDGTGQTSCKSCDSGQYQDQTGHTSCKSCDAGQYQNATGQTSCKACSWTEDPTSDRTDCQCKDGYGGSPCTECEAGKHSHNGECASCGGGYQDQTGQTSCKDCVEGYTNDANTTCTVCPLNDHKYDWDSGCPEWSTDDGCFCNCTGSGFTGEHCDICAKGMGWNGVLGADAKCVDCSFPTVNDQTTHSAVCSHDFCPPGWGTTSDEAAWLADNSTIHHDNCVECTGNTVSPDNYGQCAEVMCDDYMTVKDTIDHTLNNTNQTNCEPCSGYNVGSSCLPIVCTSGRMKEDHDGSGDGDRYIDYGLEPNDEKNCEPCGADEVVSTDRMTCEKIVCPAGFKILVVDPTLSYNNQTNCEECAGITYAQGTECIGFDCGSNRVMKNFDRTFAATKCGEQCTGDTILDVNDLTQCVACEGDTVVNSDHTECVTSVCRVGYTVSVTDRSLTPEDGYHQDANCEEIDDCITASCSPCGDLINGYVCKEEIELRQGIEAFANANKHVCPSGFRLSSEVPANAADIGLRGGACPLLKVFAEKLSIHEGVFRSKLVGGTVNGVLGDKACKYTYEDLISGTYEV